MASVRRTACTSTARALWRSTRAALPPGVTTSGSATRPWGCCCPAACLVRAHQAALFPAPAAATQLQRQVVETGQRVRAYSCAKRLGLDLDGSSQAAAGWGLLRRLEGLVMHAGQLFAEMVGPGLSFCFYVPVGMCIYA